MIKIDKIFGDKKTNAVIYILLIAGIILLLWGSGATKGISEEPPPHKSTRKNTQEGRLEQILSEIEGVGEVSVMICAENSDAEKSQMVFSAQSDSFKKASGGVLVVARGGADVKVQEKIIRAVNAALGVEPHKIQVLERVVCEDDDGN